MTSAPSSSSPPRETDLTRTYVLVVVVEIVTLLVLYGLGKYFA